MEIGRLSPTDLGFFSGFAAGDGSFVIRENNAGTSWCCGFQLKLRADDTPLLSRLREWSGVGELIPAPARGGSHPQMAWVVARREDCIRLVDLLDASPPLGKAARVFELWRSGVRLWDLEGGAAPGLERVGGQLAELRHRHAPSPTPVHITRAELAPFLSGFVSAEAHFGASAHGHPAFRINLRSDDGPLLRGLRDAVGAGYLRDVPAAGRSKAALSWRIGRLSGLRQLVEVLDECPPRGRAGRVYEAWRGLVVLEPRRGGARRRLAAEIKQRRAYRPGFEAIPAEGARERSRRRCLVALEQWVQACPDGGSARVYEDWRTWSAPDAPTRNTVAAAFGSWRGALDAAGIDPAVAMPASRVAAIRAGSAATRARRRQRQRELILEAVEECVSALGREPRATEFLRWRAQHAPDSPCQMSIYRAFPGGWEDVLACARTARAA
jgi:hypothetical protein